MSTFLRLLMLCGRCGQTRRIDAFRLDLQRCYDCKEIGDWMEPWELSKSDVDALRKLKIDPEADE